MFVVYREREDSCRVERYSVRHALGFESLSLRHDNLVSADPSALRRSISVRYDCDQQNNPFRGCFVDVG